MVFLNVSYDCSISDLDFIMSYTISPETWRLVMSDMVPIFSISFASNDSWAFSFVLRKYFPPRILGNCSWTLRCWDPHGNIWGWIRDDPETRSAFLLMGLINHSWIPSQWNDVEDFHGIQIYVNRGIESGICQVHYPLYDGLLNEYLQWCNTLDRPGDYAEICRWIMVNGEQKQGLNLRKIFTNAVSARFGKYGILTHTEGMWEIQG